MPTFRAMALIAALRWAYFDLLSDLGLAERCEQDREWRALPALAPLAWRQRVDGGDVYYVRSSPVTRWVPTPGLLRDNARSYVRHSVGVCMEPTCFTVLGGETWLWRGTLRRNARAVVCSSHERLPTYQSRVQGIREFRRQLCVLRPDWRG